MSKIIDSFSEYSSKKDEEKAWSLTDYLTDKGSESNKQNKDPFTTFNFEKEINNTNQYRFYFFDQGITFNIEELNSSENRINQRREDYLHKNVTPLFLNILKEEDFEFGFKTRSEEILREQFQINALAARNWLNELFLRYFHDETVLLGILRIVGRFDEQMIFPQGQTMALAALNHENDEIKELGIRAFEKWCSPESINILKKIKIEKKWLNDYVQQVISDLEEEVCHY